MLPDWLDIDRLNFALVGGVFSLIVAALAAMRLIRKLALAAMIAVVLAGAALLLLTQWAGLRDCRETCSCSAFGRTVRVPGNPLCGPDRIEPGQIQVDVDFGTRTPSN